MEAGHRLALIGQHIAATQPFIQYSSTQQLLTVSLNRPKALNSLNLTMIRDLSAHLPLLNKHQVVWLQGNGGKAFCAGGDVKVLFEPHSTVQDRLTFFREEFILDYRLSQLQSLQISCWDGIVMGGGVGISVFAPIIIATQKTMFAMPQVKLGFFTDIGSTYILSRMRNNIGYYMGMTGSSLKGEDVYIAGLANFYIPSQEIPQVYKEVAHTFRQKVDDPKSTVMNILKKYHKPSGRTQIANQEQISKLFSLGSARQIEKQALSQTDQFHKGVAKALQTYNPASSQLILRLIRQSSSLSLKQCFIRDYQIIEHMVVSADFKEGVRCVLKEKGATAKWSCRDLSSLSQWEVQKFWKPICWSQPLPLK